MTKKSNGHKELYQFIRSGMNIFCNEVWISGHIFSSGAASTHSFKNWTGLDRLVEPGSDVVTGPVWLSDQLSNRTGVNRYEPVKTVENRRTVGFSEPVRSKHE